MEALKLFSRHAPNRTFIAILLGSLSGLFYAFLIPIVMKALQDDNSSYVLQNKVVEFFGMEVVHSQFALLFIAICVLIFVFKSLSEILLSRIALDIRFKLRKELYKRIQNSQIASQENVGMSRLIQALSTDVSSIVIGAQLFPQLLTSTVTLVGMLGYLALLDYDAFIFIFQIIIVGIVSYQIPIYFGTKYFSKAREHQDFLQEAFKGLVGGAKELKLSIEKQQIYEQQVLDKEELIVRELEKKGFSIYSLASNYGGLLSFFAIGGLSFVFVNYNPIANASVIATVMILLYVTGPIATLLNFIPQLARTRISLKKIDQLYKELPAEKAIRENSALVKWNSLRLRNVKYRHVCETHHSKAFEIGPVNIDIKRGQITFIAGGNGSGKSTLAKVISLHYLITDGRLFYDDNELNSENLVSFRQEISCIYSDYYLFDRLLNVNSLDNQKQKQVNYYLKAFGLNEKVKIENGHFSTLKLSDGQRRRLALVVAIIEDKSLLVFDEWAADQDPQFKEVFYYDILTDLKNRNKAVVVISHDDRYFDVADQLLVMESGKLKS